MPGIVDELRTVMSLATNEEYNPVQMLDVVKSLLEKIVNRESDIPEEAAEAGLAIVESVQEMIRAEGPALTGRTANRSVIARGLRAKVNSVRFRPTSNGTVHTTHSHQNRTTIINSASRAFDAEQRSGKGVLCDRIAWVNQALRDREMSTLTVSEKRSIPLN